MCGKRCVTGGEGPRLSSLYHMPGCFWFPRDFRHEEWEEAKAFMSRRGLQDGRFVLSNDKDHRRRDLLFFCGYLMVACRVKEKRTNPSSLFEGTGRAQRDKRTPALAEDDGGPHESFPSWFYWLQH